jgi:hypothetical protein
METKDFLPALLTLIAGAISVWINWLIAKKLRESTKENLNKQLDESRKIKLAEIKSSINTRNRQEWMNQFREAITEYIVLISMSIMKADKSENGEVVLKKILTHNVRLSLLLNPKREIELKIINLYKEVLSLTIEQLKDGKNNFDLISKKNIELIELSRTLLENNWVKLNTIE